MMKKLLAVLAIYCIIPLSSFSNPIDSIQTPEQLKQFLVEKVDTGFRNFNPYDSGMAESHRFCENLFFKLDLDGNGLTDLLVNEGSLFAIFSDSNGYSGVSLDYDYDIRYVLKDIIYAGDQPLIIAVPYSICPAPIPKDYSAPILKDSTGDTLAFKFGSFINYNPKPLDYHIEKIDFSIISGWVGTIFGLEINKNLQTTYTPGDIEDPNYPPGMAPQVETHIDSIELDSLTSLLNYIGFPKLKDHYKTDWTDEATAYLTVYYDNGHVKEVEDYGLRGTPGLRRLYSELHTIRQRDFLDK